MIWVIIAAWLACGVGHYLFMRAWFRNTCLGWTTTDRCIGIARAYDPDFVPRYCRTPEESATIRANVAYYAANVKQGRDLRTGRKLTAADGEMSANWL